MPRALRIEPADDYHARPRAGRRPAALPRRPRPSAFLRWLSRSPRSSSGARRRGLPDDEPLSLRRSGSPEAGFAAGRRLELHGLTHQVNRMHGRRIISFRNALLAWPVAKDAQSWWPPGTSSSTPTAPESAPSRAVATGAATGRRQISSAATTSSQAARAPEFFGPSRQAPGGGPPCRDFVAAGTSRCRTP